MQTCTKCGRTLPPTDFDRLVAGQDKRKARCKTCRLVEAKEYRAKNRETHNKWHREWWRNRRKNATDAQRKVLRAIDLRGHERKKAQRTAFFHILQKDGCVCCGEKRFTCLDFHHLDPNAKEKKIGTTYALSKLVLELIKCVVVCSNCHRLVHSGEIQLPEGLVPIRIPGQYAKGKWP